MFKREIKINFKSFLIWLLVLIGIFLVGFLIYPSIMNSENVQMMNEMMAIFPEEVLKAFNMDISSIETVYGWIKSEGFTLVLLIVGCYAGIMGSNNLLKEENDKTIEYLNSLPITRKDIVINKVSVVLIYITAMVILLGIFNYIGLSLSGPFDKKQYLLLSLTPLLPAYVIYFLCMYLSTFTNKTKKMLGLSLGIVLFSYVLQIFSTMAESTEFLKYFSIFTLADLRNVIVNVRFNPIMVVISVVLSSVFFILTLINYNKKDFV